MLLSFYLYCADADVTSLSASPRAHLPDLLYIDMARVRGLLLLCALAAFNARATELNNAPSSYVAPGVFPTQLYASYYNDPTATSAQPQPVISDPVLVRTRTCLVSP